MDRIRKFEKSLLPEESLALHTARWVLDPREENAFVSFDVPAINWQRYCALVDYHELYPFASSLLKKCRAHVPQEVSDALELAAQKNTINQFYLHHEFKRIAFLFTQRQYAFIPLKGVAFQFERIYGDDILQRPMADIDILIEKKNLDELQSVLEESGYRKHLLGLKEEYWRQKSYHLAFLKNEPNTLPSGVELHWALDVERRNRVLPDLWKRSKFVEDGDLKIRLLSPEDSFLSLVVNQRHFGRTVCIKHALDAILLLRKYGSVFDWDYILRESFLSGLRSALFYLFSLSSFISGMPIPVGVERGLKIPSMKKKAIRCFVQKNIFGKRNERAEKALYAEALLLMFDTMREPLHYMLTIPQEKFALFYSLSAYEAKTSFLYNHRLLYGLVKAFRGNR